MKNVITAGADAGAAVAAETGAAVIMRGGYKSFSPCMLSLLQLRLLLLNKLLQWLYLLMRGAP